MIVADQELATEEKVSLSSLIRKELAQLEIDADVFVKSPSDVEMYRDKVGSIIANALKKGIAI